MSRLSDQLQFRDLHPGERYVLSLMDGSPILIKTSENTALLDHTVHITMNGDHGNVPVFAIDRGVFSYGIVEKPQVEPGLYRHYQRGLCDVYGTATDHDTDRTVVIFMVLQTGRLWTRSLAEFTDKVMHEGVLIDRFTRIKDDDHAEA